MVGDLAEKVAIELHDDVVGPSQDVADDPVVDMEQGIFGRIRFSWRKQDRDMRDRFQAASHASFLELFADAISVVDDLYSNMWVPRTNEHGIVMSGPDGRRLWVTDERGRPIEKIEQLTGQDIHQTILSLQKVLLEITPQVEALMIDAVMAHNIAKDHYDDAWFSMVEGTQGDRTARANRESRQDRWHSFFRFALHHTAKSFLAEINAFIRRLDNIGYRLSRSEQ